jgi:hypothetical protein
VLGAPVPITAVDEYGDTGTPKNDVCSSTEFGLRASIHAVAEPLAMEKPADR